jgi:hypothetical protein
MRIRVKPLVSLALLIGLHHAAASFCEARTDAFTTLRIHSDLKFNPAWATPLPVGEEKQDFERIISQQFHYLGCGGQCFAFVSDDDQYVIKFFKHKIRKPTSALLLHTLPAPFEAIRTRKLEKILSKLDRDFGSYKLAYEELPQETGILYIHLNKTQGLNQQVTICDKLNIAHQIDLDGIEFILQKKADMAYPYLEHLVQENKLKEAEAAIDSLVDVVVSRCHKGIFDEDAKIHRNFGFIQGQAVVIDVGRFRHDAQRKDPQVYRKDVAAITRTLHLWLDEHCPELTPHLEEKINSL